MTEFQTVSESELQSVEGGGVVGAVLYPFVLAIVEVVLMADRVVKTVT